jgi:iron complex outermembrane receptor protein/vitamin B12 transporter
MNDAREREIESNLSGRQIDRCHMICDKRTSGNRSRVGRGLYLFVMFMFLAAPLCRVSASTVRGVVTDPLGAVVPHAQVELLSKGQKVSETLTDEAGQYELTATRAGRFRLRVTAPTFAATETDFFYLGSPQNISENVLLKIQGMAQEVVVTATGVPVSEAQEGASVDVLTQAAMLSGLEVMNPLLSIPGLQMGKTGEHGGETSLFIRGGNADANKVLMDGVPVNDIGGMVDFGSFFLPSIDHIEVFRGPDSVLYGSDALAGVVSLQTQRGTTLLPELSYSASGGNFGTGEQQGQLAGAWRRLDYLSSFTRFDTSNSLPNSRFHVATFAGNIGWSLNPENGFRVTVRRIASGLGLPNAFDFYGLPDNQQAANHDTFIGATYENQATSKWHNLIRYGRSQLDSHTVKPSQVGITPDGINFFGLPVTIQGANGFSVNGQALLSSAGCCPSLSLGTANLDFVYGQTDYRFNSHVIGLLGYRYQAERGTSAFFLPAFNSDNSITRRNQDVLGELHGDFLNRVFYSLGLGVEKNAVFGVAATPRASLAYYLFRPAQGLFRGTKLKFSFGQGIQEPSIFDETNSLFDLLSQVAGGPQAIRQFGIKPIGAERSRTYDFGIQQTFLDRALLNVTAYHNQYYDQIEFVGSNVLPELGVPVEVVGLAGFGATVNSMNYLAQGVETDLQFKISRAITARGGYTYLDARVQRSFSSDAVGPSINPDFPNTPIGADSPLLGARPFRRAPHTGFLSVTFSRSRWDALFQGTFVGPRDDSTFLLGSDVNFGNTLLLPNRNLDGAYQKLDLAGDYKLNHHMTVFASLENLLSERYSTAFGFPALPFNLRAGLRVAIGGER